MGTLFPTWSPPYPTSIVTSGSTREGDVLRPRGHTPKTSDSWLVSTVVVVCGPTKPPSLGRGLPKTIFVPPPPVRVFQGPGRIGKRRPRSPMTPRILVEGPSYEVLLGPKKPPLRLSFSLFLTNHQNNRPTIFL